MEFVSPFITPVVESLLVPVKRHLGFFFSSTKYDRDMRTRLRELNSTAIDMKKRMEENDARNLVVPYLVPSWLERAEGIDREVDGISEDGNGCLHMKRRYKTGKRCSNFIKRIDRLMREKSNMEWTNEQIPLGMVSSATPQVLQDVTQNIFKSRQLIFQRALQLLEPDNPTQMVALCGMGGIGKTTMMEELKKVVENMKLFDRVQRVVMGKSTDPITFQEAIAQYTGGNLLESTKEARADRLKEIFLGMSQDGKKKILIILDDLWNIVDLNDIGLASPLPKGFKLFLTSRDERLCSQMGVETSSILRMVSLEEVEAKQLFWDTTGLSDGAVDHQLIKLGEDIVKRCGGLPMAIKTIALALRGEVKDAWRVTLIGLHRHDLQDLYAVVYHIFEISYNFLKKDDDKEIFLLSGLYPDDFDIPLEDLMRYGWGLKLFNKVYSLAEARQRTNTSVHNLIRANLLIESDLIGCVKMHDLARSFVLSNISKFKQASVVNHSDLSEWPTEDTWESCERILLKCKGMSEFPRCFDYPDLKLLKLMMNEKEPLMFPEDFYTKMKNLQVISYRSILYPQLPISLQCSTSLRMLCLRSCSLMGDLSYLGNLSNLEILSFAYCRIKILPSAMGKLRKLKLLDLIGCVELCIGDGVFQNLDKLEELYMRNLSYKVISFTEDNCEGLEMLKLIALEIEFFENMILPNNVSFKKLERFRISIGCQLDTIYDNDVYSYENTLRLVASCEEVRAFEISELFEKTEKLHLQVEDINHIEDVLMHPSQYSFCNLKHLSFEKCTNLSYLFTVNVASTLTNLERLKVSSCRVLGFLIHDENNGAQVITFHKLKHLVLEELPSFVGLCDNINIVMNLPQLLELRLAYLPNFTCIFASSNDISATTIPLLNKEVVSPKLEELEICGMKKLKDIWVCEKEYDRTPVLKEIEVDECDDIKNLFPNNSMPLLSHLEKILVQNCGSIQALFYIDLECIGQVNSSLKSIRASGLRKLREVWRIKDEDNSGLLIRSFHAMEFIQINQCENFRNIVTPKTIKFDMAAIIDITIDLSGEKWGTNYKSVDKENEILEVDDNPIVAVPSFSIHTLHHLSNIKLCKYKQMEVIFDIEIPSVGIVTPNNDEQPLLLPRLTNMTLIGMNSMTHLWKCNWSKFLMLQNYQQKLSFQNLTTIYMEKCKTIEYLFSPLMAKLLSNLKKVDIHNCGRIQEVVSNRDDKKSTTSTSTSTPVILFPHLDCLTLYNLERLKHIGGGIPKGTTHVWNDNFVFSVSWSLGQYCREIKIRSCQALSTVIPYYAAKQLLKIEVLEIDECSSMMEVFETKELKDSLTFSQGSGDRDDTPLAAIPRLKGITMHKMPNLKILDLETCHRLVDIFTFSTLASLRVLEKLNIRDCRELKVIVREEHGEQTTTSKVVTFPCLKSIKLTRLPNLKGFFFGMNEFQMPLLDEVYIKRCPQMMVFTSLPLRAPKLKYIDINAGKYTSTFFLTTTTLPQTPSQSLDNTNSSTPISEESMLYSQSLIEMDANDDWERKVIFSYDELPQLLNLQKLNASHCESVLEVFDNGTGVRCSNSSQTAVKLPKLRDVSLWELNSLKSIWRSNGQTILEFPNLTKLSIHDCKQFEHVFTRSMVGSVLQLKELSISVCPGMEVIVKEDQEEEEGCDGKVNEMIRLPRLKELRLENLASLKGFCLGNVDFLLPSLNSMEFGGCKSLTMFTKGGLFVPELKLIKTSLGYINLAEEQDINSFIITKRQEGFHFGYREY
uniref:uncharacterized protein LOC122604202 n=1 Tax=Erigeron canadensis TaxID=72917 RepID=UPI001CB8C8B4|nr:uncharacterized protein LOC122604202 [Erigeron canadensis]